VSTDPGSRAAAIDYPETDRRGEGELQRLITEMLRPLLAEVLASRGVLAHVGADQFLYYVEGQPTERIAPDIYVLPDVPPSQIQPSWRIWELARPPALVVEVVSRDVAKDYEDVPVACDRMGVEELVIFDPEAPLAPGRVVRRDLERVRFQVFRRAGARLARVVATNDDRVESTWLGAHLRAIGEGTGVRLRIGTGPDGEALFPTAAERADSEAARAEAEAARAEAERRRADSAERRVAELLAEIARRERG
jgi:Uma2 family endonuclease